MSGITLLNTENLRINGYKSVYDWTQKLKNVYVGEEIDEVIKGKSYKIISKWFNPFSAEKYGLKKSLMMYVIHLFESRLIYDIDELKGKNIGILSDKLYSRLRFKNGMPASHASILFDIIQRCYDPLEILIKRKKKLIQDFSRFGTITITFGEQAENHVGMQILGEGLRSNGLSIEELHKAQENFNKRGAQTELIMLNDLLPEGVVAEPAAVLIVRNGINIMLQDLEMTKYEMLKEQIDLDWDQKAFMRGQVKNKRARFNLIYGSDSQEPDYMNKKGRIVAWRDIPISEHIHSSLPKYFGEKALDLQGEGNYYYDVAKCGIGFHGDSERKIVIALRLGQQIPIEYQWFYRHKPVGIRGHYNIAGGDLYAMSEKATGFDWKRSSVYTLRHAAGCEKYLKTK